MTRDDIKLILEEACKKYGYTVSVLLNIGTTSNGFMKLKVTKTSPFNHAYTMLSIGVEDNFITRLDIILYCDYDDYIINTEEAAYINSGKEVAAILVRQMNNMDSWIQFLIENGYDYDFSKLDSNEI